MGNKIITEKDFWMCTGGNVPAQLQSTQLSTKKKDGKKYITLVDTATSSMMDFGCNKLMLIMAIVAAVIAVCVVATGGAALIAIGALAGAAGAAVGAVMGGLICGQIAAMARIWTASKSNMIVQGKPAITGDHQMQCMLFGDTITFAPNIKNWWQAITIGAINTSAKVVEGALSGAMVGMGAGFLNGSIKLALPTLSSIGGNIATSFGVVGGSIRGLFGVQNLTDKWATGEIETMTEAATAFKDGALPEAGSIYRICTGQAESQDALLALYLLNIKFPNKTKSSTNKSEEPIKNTTQKATTKPKSTKPKKGEAYEASKLKPNTPEHKAQRWKDYLAKGGKWSEERWSKQYDTNMKNNSHGLGMEKVYRDKLGGVSKTLKTKHTNRQIDIYKPKEKYAGQLKTGKHNLTKQAKIDIKKDAWLVKRGNKVEYILEKGGSKPLLKALKKNGIDYHIGTKLP